MYRLMRLVVVRLCRLLLIMCLMVGLSGGDLSCVILGCVLVRRICLCSCVMVRGLLVCGDLCSWTWYCLWFLLVMLSLTVLYLVRYACSRVMRDTGLLLV